MSVCTQVGVHGIGGDQEGEGTEVGNEIFHHISCFNFLLLNHEGVLYMDIL